MHDRRAILQITPKDKPSAEAQRVDLGILYVAPVPPALPAPFPVTTNNPGIPALSTNQIKYHHEATWKKYEHRHDGTDSKTHITCLQRTEKKNIQFLLL